MSMNELVTSITLPAAADYSTTGQYLCVGINSSGEAVLIAGQGLDAIGVLQNDPAAQNAATVAIHGVTKVEAGGTVAAGDKVTTSATGAVEAAATGDFVIGWATTGGASGEIISVLLTHQDVSA